MVYQVKVHEIIEGKNTKKMGKKLARRHSPVGTRLSLGLPVRSIAGSRPVQRHQIPKEGGRVGRAIPPKESLRLARDPWGLPAYQRQTSMVGLRAIIGISGYTRPQEES